MSFTGSTGVFTTDLSLVIRSWDQWLTDATGIPEADACGRPLAELFPDLEERGHLARLRHVASTGTVAVLAPAFHQHLLALPPRSPSAHFARMQQHVTIAPLRAGEAMVGIAVTIHDVTARRDRERELASRLASGDEGERLQAVRALDEEGGALSLGGGGFGDAFGVHPLADALGDASWRVRRAAADSLARARDDAAVDALLAALRERHRDPAVLNATLTALRHSAHDVVPPLLELLVAATADADVRTYVALALGLLEDRRAVDALVTAAQDDPDANVRYHAIEALGRIGSRAAAAAVATIAESRDFAVAFVALDTLALLGEPSVAPRLTALLDDDLLCSAAADALGRLGGEDVAGPLAATLARPGVPAGAVASALAHLADRLSPDDARRVAERARRAAAPAIAATVEQLVGELPNATDDERHGIVVVLGWLADDAPDAIVAALTRALAYPRVRRLAAELLSRRGTAAVAPLLDALGATDMKGDGAGGSRAEDSWELRKAAAAALGRVGSPAAVPALVQLLDAPPELAVVAAGALGGVGDRGALEALLAHLDHPHAAVRQAVVAALCSIGHPELPQRVRELLASDAPRLREAGSKIAGYLGDEANLSPMLALASDGDDMVRRAVIEQLASFDDPRATTTVAQALRDGSPGVRAAAARAFSHMNAEQAVPALLEACRDADPWVRYYAARSAGHVRDVQAVDTLVALATWDAVPPVRIAAIEALVEIRDEAGLTPLVPLARDDDAGVRRPALRAMGALRDAASLEPLLVALADDDRDCRLAALAALGARAGDGEAAVATPAVAGLARADGDREVRAAALDVLARLGTESAIAALVALAGEPRRSAAAVAALASVDERHVETIARGLADPDAGTRCAVVEALARLRVGASDSAVARALASALDDASEAVRRAAAEALSRRDLRAAEGEMDRHVVSSTGRTRPRAR